jgi:hypothetical protein
MKYSQNAMLPKFTWTKNLKSSAMYRNTSPFRHRTKPGEEKTEKEEGGEKKYTEGRMKGMNDGRRIIPLFPSLKKLFGCSLLYSSLLFLAVHFSLFFSGSHQKHI